MSTLTDKFFQAINISDDEAVQELIDQGADVNAVSNNIDDPYNKDLTPLLVAIRGRSIHIAKILIEAGADVNLTGKRGLPPIHMAFIHNQRDILEILLEHGANENSKDRRGRTLWQAFSDDSPYKRACFKIVDEHVIKREREQLEAAVVQPSSEQTTRKQKI